MADIHNRTAMELFGEVNRDTRGRAKTINFAILYGISRWGLAGRLDVTPDEAQAMISRYFERFPGINRYIADTLNACQGAGFTDHPVRPEDALPAAQGERIPTNAPGSERAAINAPIQGTCADIIKRAMARMGPALLDAGLPNVRMLLQVHDDELVFEAARRRCRSRQAGNRAGRAWRPRPNQRSSSVTVPLGVEIGVGPGELGRARIDRSVPTAAAGGEDIDALAKGGRTNMLGFMLRLAARLPFLFIAGRAMARTSSGAMRSRCW
jgi:DNA polymerase-1